MSADKSKYKTIWLPFSRIWKKIKIFHKMEKVVKNTRLKKKKEK